MKITETTGERTFAIEATESEIRGIEALLGYYANGSDVSIFTFMQGIGLSPSEARALAHQAFNARTGSRE